MEVGIVCAGVTGKTLSQRKDRHEGISRGGLKATGAPSIICSVGARMEAFCVHIEPL